jgi:pimeloyl-ACP methyl ester carboxylesterase
MIKKLFLGLALLIALGLILPPLWFAIFPEPVPELPPAGRRVEVAPGVGVNVIERGSGRTLVLVHGQPGSAYDWIPLMDALAARGYRALAYDRVGYGHSGARSEGDFSLQANARELLGLLAAEDLRTATVIGWSYGGAIAITAARQDASRIERVALVCSVGPGIERDSSTRAAIGAWLGRRALAWVLRVPPLAQRASAAFLQAAFAPETPPPGLARNANLAQPHTRQTFLAEGFDLDGRVELDPGPIDRPILVIHGDGDLLAPPSIGRNLARSARNGELWMVPGGGHALPVTRPDALADRIASFVGDPARR